MSTDREDLAKVHQKATDLLAQYYGTVRLSRKSQQRRETLIARLDTDSELCTSELLLNSTPIFSN